MHTTFQTGRDVSTPLTPGTLSQFGTTPKLSSSSSSTSSSGVGVGVGVGGGVGGGGGGGGLSQKRYEIGPWLLWNINRMSRTVTD